MEAGLATGSGLGTIVATLGSGIAQWLANKSSLDRLQNDLGKVRGDISNIRERMAKLEGLFDGFTKQDREAG